MKKEKYSGEGTRMEVKLISVTPEADVSNLLSYYIKHDHFILEALDW